MVSRLLMHLKEPLQHDAVKSLFSTPQNNLRVWLDGVEIMPNHSDEHAWIRNVIVAMLRKSRVLHQLYELQQLTRMEADDLIPLIADMPHGTTNVFNCKKVTLDVKNYFASAAFRDCSIMLTCNSQYSHVFLVDIDCKGYCISLIGLKLTIKVCTNLSIT